MGIIELIVTSKWISPIVISRKKDCSIRLCVDLREPNKAVILDAYPIPLIEDILSSLHGLKVFTNLDLSQAYHQIKFHSEFRQKSLKFFGYIIYDNRVHLDGELMKHLLDAPPPKDKSGLRSLIGIITWFQKYLYNKSTILEPLQKFLKKGIPFKWGNFLLYLFSEIAYGYYN
ncbi:K02A2.6-like [Cordylochernes scorpioides]|uniref:K02A2.6-like n=1 Tax=Cordylochernes scorpioides TaxID=51811 RepID=A0ABY6L5P9_9ARAC|nr:K02A2.6-like [Cordylochernes scorpioides]